MSKVYFLLLLGISFTNASFSDGGPSQNFQSRSENILNDKIHGQYSYVDPLGSLVVVKYSTNLDGSNYTEKRQIDGSYRKKSSNENDITEINGFSETSSGKFELLKKAILGETVDNSQNGMFEKLGKFLSERYEHTGKVVGNLFCEYLSSMNKRVIDTEQELVARIFNTSFAMIIGVEGEGTSMEQSSESTTEETTESFSEEPSSSGSFGDTSVSPLEGYDQIYSDMWSLLQIYSHEAICQEDISEVNIKSENSKTGEAANLKFESGFERVDTMNPDLSVDIVSDLRPMINSTVERMMKLITSATPADDELLVGNILAQLQPYITPRFSKVEMSLRELDTKLEDVNGLARAIIFEQIHNYRLSRQQQPLAETRTFDSVLWSNKDISEQGKYLASDQKWQPSDNIQTTDQSPRGFPPALATRAKPPTSYTYTYQRSGSG